MAHRRRERRAKFKFRMPFLDRGLPTSPYVTGTRFWIQAHDPPPPFGKGYRSLHRRGPEALARMREEQLPQSIYCLANQPPGPEPPADAPRMTIDIVEELRPRLIQGSHVVGCRIVTADGSNGDDDGIIVAKIFDPMYYCHNGNLDIVELADMEYCREAAAYQHLCRTGVDGRWLPGYRGSFTLELPLTDEQVYFLTQYKGADHPLLQAATPVRRVRLILVDKVMGQPMTYQLVYGSVGGLSDEARLDVVASTLEAYAHLHHHAIVHGDLAPRNVFLRDEGENDGKSEQQQQRNGASTGPVAMASRRLRFHRFVDLGLSYVLGGPFSTISRQPANETRPRNPIQLFWDVFESGAVDMYYWIPPDLRNTAAFQRWLLSRWYGDTRFEPVEPVPAPAAEDLAWATGSKMTGGDARPKGQSDGVVRGALTKAGVVRQPEQEWPQSRTSCSSDKAPETMLVSVTIDVPRSFW